MLLYVLVLISGFSSLIYEIVWMRALSLIYGNTAYATGMILALFMGGMAAGAFAFGRSEVERPVRLYGVLEGIVGVWGLCGTLLLDHVQQWYVGVSGVYGLETAVRSLMLAALILPPTFLMGASLPLLLRARMDFERRGMIGGLIYGINTVGGLLGTLFSGFWSIPWVGLRTTVLVAVTGNVVVCAAALAYREVSRPRQASASGGTLPPARDLLLAFFLCGASSLSLEVYWTRILVLEIGSSVYAYSLLLATFLLGVGLGSILGGFVADHMRSGLRMTLACLEVGLALSVFLQYKLIAGFAMRTGAIDAFLSPLGPFAAQSLALLLNTAQFVIVPTAIMGASFPILLRVAAVRPGAEQREAGNLYLANTAGGVLGALMSSFLVLQLLGAHHGMYLATILNLAAAVCLMRGQPGRRALYSAVAVALVIDGVLWWSPSILLRSYLLTPASGRRLVSFAEDASATVTVEEVQTVPPWRSVSVNGVNVAGTAPDLLDIQSLQGHLPLLLADTPRTVLHIGFGSGGTAHAVSTHGVTEIRVAEISPAVVGQASRFFRDVNRGVFDDPRLSFWYGDGRNYLLRSNETFDVILSDSIHPRYSGNGSLYTEEYYELCRSRLAEGGVVSQWLPLYTLTPNNFKMILRAFVDVFPSTTVWYVHSTVNPFTVVIGKKRRGPPIQLHNLILALRRPAVSKNLAERGHADPIRILSYFVAGGPRLASLLSTVPPHRDDRPLVEYESGRLVGRETWYDNFEFLRTALGPVTESIDWTGIGGRDAAEIALEIDSHRVRAILEDQSKLLRGRAYY
ncbi:MAG: fused MFS/spermidine synthase [Acidobacteriota bacterium]